MRILSIIQTVNPASGGPAEALSHLTLEYLNAGVDYELLTLDLPDSSFLSSFPVKVNAIGPAKGVFGYSPAIEPWLVANRDRFDAVIVHGLWQFHGIAARRTLRNRIPYCVFCHGMLDPWFNQQYPLKRIKKWFYWQLAQFKVLRDAERVLFTTEEEMLLARTSFAPYRVKERVIKYGTRLPSFDLVSCKDKWYETYPEFSSKRVFLYLSRIHPKKGIDLLMPGFAKIALEIPNAHLVIAGPDPDNLIPTYRKIAQNLGIDNRITWPGLLRGELKWGAFAAADAFVLPSHQENFGIAVAEALAASLPVITTNKVNIWREIEACQAGIIVDDSQTGIDHGLRRFVELSHAEKDAMRINAQNCFAQNFSVEAAATSILGAIEEAVSDFQKI